MKSRNLFLSLTLSLTLAFCAAAAMFSAPVTVQASGQGAAEQADGEMWSEAYYRASSTTDGLSEAEKQSLDQACLEFMRDNKVDLAVLEVTASNYEGSNLSDLADGYYEDCGFGYGPGRDGFLMVWDSSNDQVLFKAYGTAADMIPASYLDFVSRSVVTYKEKYGSYGPLYAGIRYLANYMRGDGAETTAETEDQNKDRTQAEGKSAEAAADTGTDSATGSTASGSTETALETALTQAEKPETADASPGDQGRMLPDGEQPDSDLRLGEEAEAAGKPAWYPKEPPTFPYYHDESAPRVVDTADIFTDDEEAQMEARLSDLRGMLGKDIVVFTDVSTYGLSRSVYAADFYDFNGYGIGDDREGICLMVCMDPDDRGWWSCCTGPETMGLYTEEVANQIDDLLFEKMRAGDYGSGAIDWIENVRRMYTTGSPYNEEWALAYADENTSERFHDPEAPRVVDDAGILSAEEIDRLTQKAAELSGKYKLDVVIHTALHEGILDRESYGDVFYRAKGYGSGDAYDGIQLTIFKRPNYSGYAIVNASGTGLDKLSGVNRSRLQDRCTDVVLHQDYFKAADQWLDQTGHMLRTGRVPRSAGSWQFTLIIEFLAGLIFGGVSLARAKASMATPAIREDADSYIVRDSVHIKKVEDTLLDSVVSRHYSPPPKRNDDDDRGSSSGRSSYSHSYSGSSGSSHSGSGRNF